MEQAKVSVIIPAYNAGKTLNGTLLSALKQTYGNLEIIVVDDGSEGPVKPLIDELNEERILYYRTARSNANVARNYGILKSSGDYIAMLDADDRWLESHIEDCLKTLEDNNADGIYGGLYFCKDQSYSKDMRQILYARNLNPDESMIDYLLTTVCGAQTSTLFTTAISAKDILWDNALIDHQDYDFVVRFHKKYKLTSKREPTTLYYTSSGRVPHFDSCIQFVENNIEDVNPVIYNNYNLKMYWQAIQKEAPKKFIDYFRKEATRYKEFLSYQQYISIVDAETQWQKFRAKLAYLFYILQIEVE